MAEINVNIPDHLMDQIKIEGDQLNEVVADFLKQYAHDQSVDGKVEKVRIITRAKAQVGNWYDLEQEIFKGGIL